MDPAGLPFSDTQDFDDTERGPDLLGALSVEQILSSVAIRIDGPKAWHVHVVLSFAITDLDETYVFELRNGVANHRRTSAPDDAGPTLTLTRRSLIELFTNRLDFAEALGDGRIVLDGDPTDLGTLVSVLGKVERNFPIVTPSSASRSERIGRRAELSQ